MPKIMLIGLAAISTSCDSVKSSMFMVRSSRSLYSMLPSIRTLKTKTQFLRRPFQFLVNEVFPMKAEHFSLKMKVLVSLTLAKQSQKTPFCLWLYLRCLMCNRISAAQKRVGSMWCFQRNCLFLKRRYLKKSGFQKVY